MATKTTQRNGIKRPLIPYLGSKWRIAPKVIAHFPPHEVYCEPFGGAAAVLLSKPPARTEIYNDLNKELVNLFCVLRNQPQKLIKALQRTPYAEAEYHAAFDTHRDPVERARRLILHGHSGFHSRAVFGDRCSWRIFGSRMGNAAKSYQDALRALPVIVSRLRHVAISCRPALKVINDVDSHETLIYADPPYVSTTRKSDAKYQFEMRDVEHQELLVTLASSKAMIVFSGYPNDLYDRALKGWQRVVIPARVFSVSKTQTAIEEVLWINPAAQKRLNNH